MCVCVLLCIPSLMGNENPIDAEPLLGNNIFNDYFRLSVNLEFRRISLDFLINSDFEKMQPL